MISQSPVIILNNGKITVPVDIDTVLASAATAWIFCGTASTRDPEESEPESTDPESTDPESVISIGKTEPLSVDPVSTPVEVTGGTGITTAPVSICPPESPSIAQLDISQEIKDLIIFTETSGITIPPEIIRGSTILLSDQVRIDPVSISTEPVFSTIITGSAHEEVITSVVSVITVPVISIFSTGSCGKNTSAEIQSSGVFGNRSRFSPPRILTTGSSGYTKAGTDSANENDCTLARATLATANVEIGFPRFKLPEMIVREPE